eukprot:TRINITY_DN3149_c0_g1_i1.p1 TRINITY_DN3149_c0_g1~~TRINITY_DN3149_c0_g1_i1.p1  ORF type:complete len:250 (+),score=15.40 TRINITY_DN3149_c0_g1_i1:111-860(+)
MQRVLLFEYSVYAIQTIFLYILHTYIIPESWRISSIFVLTLYEVNYWVIVALHMYMDRHPERWWGKYKIPTKETIKDTQMLPLVIFNHVVLIIVFYTLYSPHFDRGFRIESIPFWRMLVEVAGYYVMYEIMFYYGHRILHWPSVYQRFHKLHHLTKGSVAISGYYMHPVDYCIESAIPFFAGLFFLNGHMVSTLVWICLASANSPHSHGGYQFPFMPLPDNHYIHHKVFNKNYGIGIFDRVHDTQAYLD